MAQALGYVTKTETGNFSGTLNLGGSNRINIVSNDNKETFKRPSSLRYVDRRGQELGSLGGCFKTCEVCSKDFILPTFVHPDPWPLVKFHSNLDQAYGKED